MTTVAQTMIDALRRLEIDQLFCLPGIQNDDFFNELVDARDIEPIVTRHEQGAAYMAMGASQITGRPAAFAVVPGPGMLNAGAALTSAYWAGGRVLALIGAIPHSLKGKGTGVLHELPDQTAVLQQVTKHAAYLPNGANATEQIQVALAALMSNEARPVSIEVPVSAWNDDVDGVLTTPQRSLPTIDEAALERAAAALSKAERPLIVVGGGAYDAAEEVRRLAERLQAPVFTRRQGHGVLDARHPLWCPLPVGREFWGQADVVLAIGTRLEFPVMHWGVDDNLQVIQVNVDESELDRHEVGTIGLHGDAAEAGRALLTALGTESVPSRADEVAEARARFDADTAHFGQRRTMEVIRDVLPDNGVIVEDVTQMGFAAHLFFEFRHPRTFLTTGPAGTLGAGVAHAIGAQAAVKDRPVLGLIGDGGFLFTATELATAAQYNIPVTLLVHDNGAYGNVKRIQEERFGPDRTIASTLKNPDFVAFGKSFGVHTQRADDDEALRTALGRAFDHDGPSLIVAAMGEVANPWPYLRMGRNRD